MTIFGYQGMVDGGDCIVEADWASVSGFNQIKQKILYLLRNIALLLNNISHKGGGMDLVMNLERLF